MTNLFKAKEPREASGKAPRLSLGAREAITGYAMITPMAIGYFIFMVVPIFIMFWLSTTNYSLFGKPKFIGFENYLTLFNDDPVFWETVWNTVYFTVLFVPLNMLICLGLALMMYKQFRRCQD